MPKGPITSVRHVGLATPDFEQSLAFYEGTWGLKRVAVDSGVAYLAAEGSPEQYIVRLRRADQKRLELLALAARDAGAVDQLAADLAASGVRFASEPDKLQTPGGGYGFRFFDPDGRVVEISSDVAPRAYRELDERESIPKRLSHVVLNTADLPRLNAFYQEKLGFMLSDWLVDRMAFLRCSPDHHSIAIVQGPHNSLNHASFELRGIDEFMRGTGRLMRGGITPLWGPGRHGPGDNTFTYFADPNGNVVEYTTALEQILDDTTWKPRVWTMDPTTADQWGTAGGMVEQFFQRSANEPDPAPFTAAPV